MSESEVKILVELVSLIKEMGNGAKDALVIYGRGLCDGSKLASGEQAKLNAVRA